MGYTLPPPSASSSSTAAVPDDPLSHAQSLIARKSEIEAELDTQLSILKSHNVDMRTPLVDREGFPRADIDIVAVRTARVRIIELRNDLNAILEEVKTALEAVHAANRQTRTEENRDEDAMQVEETAAEEPTIPFARVDGVAPGSPAASAVLYAHIYCTLMQGLQREDVILAFGSFTISSITSTTSSSTIIQASSLAPLATLAAEHENQPLNIRILRNSQPITLTLIPRKWGGRGLIGCHIVPYTSS
ncbi:uncharacterized protein FOMMEDRAFT_96697 [Fomitiporia mediterranea MF3/22]|uniref:uncharacterized protein n=1 Tax=Fomitiporia mediterranea (strain MF3/22) TaxID=694068 RepID=UPI000440826A|nr:uncharacterized protein FOMMEDRAFT_96697 [Fomitiporia mediterranea MF3/22]EJC98455.1 hypothetical protein FOMMEDRAFT_96697 [Fomitiporia mediterranea MF3/22]